MHRNICMFEMNKLLFLKYIYVLSQPLQYDISILLLLCLFGHSQLHDSFHLDMVLDLRSHSMEIPMVLHSGQKRLWILHLGYEFGITEINKEFGNRNYLMSIYTYLIYDAHFIVYSGLFLLYWVHTLLHRSSKNSFCLTLGESDGQLSQWNSPRLKS